MTKRRRVGRQGTQACAAGRCDGRAAHPGGPHRASPDAPSLCGPRTDKGSSREVMSHEPAARMTRAVRMHAQGACTGARGHMAM